MKTKLPPDVFPAEWYRIDGLHFDRRGVPISMARWSELQLHESYRRIASDYTRGYHVSTIWLGLDHSFGGGPPQIFETMVFDTKPTTVRNSWAASGYSEYCLDAFDIQLRYSSEREARQGHWQTRKHVRKLAQGLSGPEKLRLNGTSFAHEFIKYRADVHEALRSLVLKPQGELPDVLVRRNVGGAGEFLGAAVHRPD